MPGDGLGAVSRADLAQDVADVPLTVNKVTNTSSAMAWFGVPLASVASTSSSRPGQLLDQARHRRSGAAPGARHGRFAVELLREPGQVAMREVSGWGLSGPAGGDDARYHLVINVEQFATPQLRTWLESRVSSVQADTWREIGERLGRLGHWEFEDYQPR